MNESTPLRLIAAARSIFAARGYDGASVREITAAAGANLGAITYHFGSKQGLYDAVLEDAVGPMTAWLAAEGVENSPSGSGLAGISGIDRVERILRRLFAHLAANPDLQLLVLRQVVQDQALPGPALRMVGTILGAVTAAVIAGQADGTIRPGDARLLAVSVVSQPVYFSLLNRLAPERLGSSRGGLTGDTVEHAVRFARAGLAGAPEEVE